MTALTTAKRRLARRKRELRDARRAVEMVSMARQEWNPRWNDRLAEFECKVVLVEQQVAEAERQLEEAWHDHE